MFFDFQRAKKSFFYAAKGLKAVWQEEQNFRFHCLAAIGALALAFWLRIKKQDFIILLILIAAVLILELVNTVFERLVDLLKPRIHEYSKEIKNFSSAIVLISAITSVIIGALIFYPYLRPYWRF